MPDIEKMGKIIGFGICLLFILFPNLPHGLQWAIFGCILVIFGIPHGAIDHLLSKKENTSKNLKIFLFNYLGMIALYFVSWIFLPKLAFIIFILMSSYHFGQTHFLNSNGSKSSSVFFIITGSYFLALILFGNFQETRKIIAPILDFPISQYSQYLILGILGLLSLFFQLMTFSKPSLLKITEFIILSVCLYYSPLPISFIVYFGFWHSIPSMKKEYDFLFQSSLISGLKSFAFKLLPFSLISLVGIGLVLIFGINYMESTNLILLFFIMVSLISFPHIIYMDRFLRKAN